MTLTEVLPTIRQLSIIEKVKLIRILAEDLEAAEDILPLEPLKTYDLPTPYNSFGAGAVLMQAAKGSNTDLTIVRFHYSTWDPSQNEFDRLPRVPIILRREGGATISP